MTDYSNAVIDEHSIILAWRRFTTIEAVPPCVSSMSVEAIRDYILDGMVIRATGHVLGENLPSHTETTTGYTQFEIPASWWQHFKHQHGHRWWLRMLFRRRPVRMERQQRSLTLTATWEHMAAYPWAQLTTPVPPGFGLGDPVRLRWLTTSMTWNGTDD